MQTDLTKAKKLKYLIYGAVSILLTLVFIIAVSPYILGMTYTYSLLATIMFRIGFVFWGAAGGMVLLCKPVIAWLNQA